MPRETVKMHVKSGTFLHLQAARNVDRKVMKPVIISILLPWPQKQATFSAMPPELPRHAVILLYTASGVLRTLGLAPRWGLAQVPAAWKPPPKWDFPKIRGALFWGPYKKDPTI